MADKFDKATRSAIMARVRSKDTGPELRLRRALFAQGLRYRLHNRLLPPSISASGLSAKVVIRLVPSAVGIKDLAARSTFPCWPHSGQIASHHLAPG